MLAYLDHLEARGELDLEAATEFLVLIAALLELKSRLMLPRRGVDELLELEPGEAAEELLARMLEARRYRGAAEHLRERLRRRGRHALTARAAAGRAAPRAARRRRGTAYEPAQLGAALGGLLRTPPPLDLRHIGAPRVSVAERLAAPARAAARAARFSLRRGRARRRPRHGRRDAVRAARALQARRGELEQAEPFGEITVAAGRGAGRRGRGMSAPAGPHARGAAVPVARARSRRGPGRRPRGRATTRSPRRSPSSRPPTRPGRGHRAARARRRLHAGHRPDAEEAARRLLARPRTPPLTPAQAETLAIVAYLQPVSRPEIARIRGVSRRVGDRRRCSSAG